MLHATLPQMNRRGNINSFRQTMPIRIFLSFLLLFGNVCCQQQNQQGSSKATVPAPAPAPMRPPPPKRPKLVPAMFVLGDSTVDSGTNNYLGTLARADHPPYGRDFDTGKPTGRFSNGRIIVDYLAEWLGLPFVPPFLGSDLLKNIDAITNGVNFASAAAGVEFLSGSDMGMHISLELQTTQVKVAYNFIEEENEKFAVDLFTGAVFYISIGSNDFIHSYFSNFPQHNNSYNVLPWNFAHRLAQKIKNELQNLYADVYLRKVVVMGLAPIGCAPHYLFYYSKNGECMDEINNVVMEFNYNMRYMVQLLNQEFPNAVFTFCDVFQGSMEILANHTQYGFETTTTACCGAGNYGGLLPCLSPDMACKNASTHVWWDEFHPTDAVNKILAENIWSSMHVNMCHPFNLQKLINLHH